MVVAKFLALFALFAVAVSAADFTEEDDVIVLTDANFAEVVEEHAPMLVEFYAPWCGHCKNLAPEYAKAAAQLKEDGIRLGKLDATAHRSMASEYKIQGFPTMKLFKNGIVVDYDGGRTKEAIVSWMMKKTGPSCKTLETVEDLEKMTADNAVVVVGVYDDLEGKEKQALDNVADADNDNVYAITNSAAVRAKLNVESGNKIVLLKQFDEKRNEFEGTLTEMDSINTFVKENSMPLVSVFSDKNAQKIFGGQHTTHILSFMDVETQTEDNKPALEEVAKKFKGQALVIIVPSHEDRIVNYFDVKSADMPSTIVVTMKGGVKKYPYPTKGEKIDAEKLGTFVQDFFDGKVKATLKSEEIPEVDDDAVKTIVGKSFEDLVLNHGGKKDVLLEFYAPWCGHCKSLAPKYEELAEKLDGIDSVLIAKMDSTANEVDHPKVDVKGFPTLKFFPANDPNNPIDYEGAREVDAFLSFLKKHVTIPFDLDGEHYGPESAEAKDEL